MSANTFSSNRFPYFLSEGERCVLVGQTGSGKTQHAISLIRNAPIFPVIIFDTKIEPEFEKICEYETDTFTLCESASELLRLSKLRPEKIPDFILVRPGIYELQDFSVLDKYCEIAFNSFGECTVYFDELYNWHNNGRPLTHFIALLTRGRSRGKTVIQSTQRPSWVSRFCFTESQVYYIHRLVDARDVKVLASCIPGLESGTPRDQYGFFFYRSGMRAPLEYSRVAVAPGLKKGKAGCWI